MMYKQRLLKSIYRMVLKHKYTIYLKIGICDMDYTIHKEKQYYVWIKS